MKITNLASIRSVPGEPPRSTAYYYADLERLKKKNDPIIQDNPPNTQNADEQSEYVESNEVFNDGAVREVPPLRDRVRQWSLPEYTTPENPRKLPGETYSTAGTFPMPEPKEKEPLLAELEVVGRLPLTQLETSSGVRRTRSWYLCCPNVADEEISRESSWRYSSLRPVTAPPMPGQNGILVATQSSDREDVTSLRAERDALARALAAERQRAAAAARAHDARLAELHGVIAELVRRRAADKHARAIPEEEVSDECESTTQPAGELDNDADRSRTEQNDTSSALSPAELPTPQERGEPRELPDDTTDTSETNRMEQPRVEVSPPTQPPADACDTSVNLSERDSDACLSTARWRQRARRSAGSCEREHGSPEAQLFAASPGRCEARQAKLASRVRLRRAGDSESTEQLDDQAWWHGEAERLALPVCAAAELREALCGGGGGGGGGGGAPAAPTAALAAWRARCLRLRADCRLLRAALATARDTAHRLYSACAVQESSCVALCGALLAADRALEAYDVLLALAETAARPGPQREAAELVARQLLQRLDSDQPAAVGEPLLSPGPWLQHDAQAVPATGPWSAAEEARLRAHAAALKARTAALRAHHPPPRLYSYHDIDEADIPKAVDTFSMDEIEEAVMMQEVLAAREKIACARAGGELLEPLSPHEHERRDDDREVYKEYKSESSRRRRRERHWLETEASETDL
ncbi:uncharacterized protein LOC113509856 isoform X2 [Galleria mellonella]|uniref:Uncharacterized protein LOC113509856 isoform X2 n=1 Tax=Galleria mellonella TaxID=7137 RepID=A0ABM3M9M5_GALME|nr:uncharacterized protein LOC113509856 isoform X2 [Galleria mellonella]